MRQRGPEGDIEYTLSKRYGSFEHLKLKVIFKNWINLWEGVAYSDWIWLVKARFFFELFNPSGYPLGRRPILFITRVRIDKMCVWMLVETPIHVSNIFVSHLWSWHLYAEFNVCRETIQHSMYTWRFVVVANGHAACWMRNEIYVSSTEQSYYTRWRCQRSANAIQMSFLLKNWKHIVGSAPTLTPNLLICYRRRTERTAWIYT